MVAMLGSAAAFQRKLAAAEQLIRAERGSRGSHPTAWMLDTLCARPLNSGVGLLPFAIQSISKVLML